MKKYILKFVLQSRVTYFKRYFDSIKHAAISMTLMLMSF